jgi:hypothetical protein
LQVLHEVRLPGTNIEVLISSNIIEIRDDDYLQSIEYSGKRYEDVLDAIQRIMYNWGWEITKRVIKYVLDRLGLPEVESFPSGEPSADEDSSLIEMIDNIKDVTGLEAEEAEELSAEDKSDLNFKFHSENVPKEESSSERSHQSKDSSFDWEEAPSVGSE